MSDTLTVAVRASDGACFHLGKAEWRVIRRLAKPDTDGKKWRSIVRQLRKQGRACTVRLVVGYTGYGYKESDFVYEEITYRPVIQAQKV